jgi:vancomycin permeability regulator SanA
MRLTGRLAFAMRGTLTIKRVFARLAGSAGALRGLLARPWSPRAKRLAVALCALFLLGLFGTAWRLSRIVARAERGAVFTVADVTPREVALVFGAGVSATGELSAPLADRVGVAAELYHGGKVRKLLMSGDNSRRTYDEVTAMKEHAVALGVPPQDVVLDYAGFRTYDSCYRARAIFDVHSAVLVTQRFHMARAIYTCSGLGVDAVGVAADRQRYRRARWYAVREALARARAYVQVRITRPRPHFLGPKVPLF